MDKYSPDYFSDFFAAIPDEQWCTGQLDNVSGQKCALGFLGVTRTVRWGGGYQHTPASNALRDRFLSLGCTIEQINDGGCALPSICLLASPKERILAALELVKKLPAKL